MHYHNSILDLIGNTPLIKLNHLNPNPRSLVLAKLETCNPTGSIKDRIGKYMVEQAIQNGKLQPNGLVIESTGAGNTGLGVILAAQAHGHKTVITTPDKNSPELIAMMRAYGAEVVICPTQVAPEDPRSYYEVARQLAQDNPGSVYINQYANPDNPAAHYYSTGPEIWEQTEGNIDLLVVGPGTGGTFTGTASYLREQKPDIVIIGPDPVDSVYSGFLQTGKTEIPDAFSRIDGIGKDFISPIAKPHLYDELIRVEDKETMAMMRRLAREEGIFAGASSGAALVALNKYAQHYDLSDKTIVLIFPDSGNRYLSKGYSDEWLQQHQLFT